MPQHILRYWEGKFSQLRPLQRAGNRRYYRPADVETARTIHRLLNHEGYTVRGVAKMLAGGVSVEAVVAAEPPTNALASDLRALREALIEALEV